MGSSLSKDVREQLTRTQTMTNLGIDGKRLRVGVLNRITSLVIARVLLNRGTC